ncbi:MAG TPA: hypothetical protein PLS63_03790 [Microthrixaceae bacterium]|jgi:hypothetical protein|nr:hypothetical protein [Microthrixaceae bacterium]
MADDPTSFDPAGDPQDADGPPLDTAHAALGTGDGPQPPRRKERRELPDRWAYTIMALLILVSIAGIAVAVTIASTGGDKTSEVLPEYVDRLEPTSGSQILQQSTVGVDVAEGYDAFLIVDGKEIKTTADGLVKQLSTGIVQFTPGPGRPVETLPSGRNCVTAMVWLAKDGERTAKPTNWCFEVT